MSDCSASRSDLVKWRNGKIVQTRRRRRYMDRTPTDEWPTMPPIRYNDGRVLVCIDQAELDVLRAYWDSKP